MLCSESALVNPGRYAFRAVTLKCRSWGCPICQPDRQRQLVALAKSGKPTTFITLTVNPATGFSPASRARALVQAWRTVVKRACQKYGYPNIPYLCVFEATKNGEPHLHILCRVKWLGQPWLSDQMKALIRAPIVHIRQVKSTGQIASYISKYIGKEPHRFASCKRYWRTQSWELPPEDCEPEMTLWSDRWYVVNRSVKELQRLWVSLGYDVALEGRLVVAMKEPPPQDASEGEIHV